MPYSCRVGSRRVILYTIEELGQMLSVSYRTAWQYVRDERIPAVKINGQYLISEHNVLAFLHGARHLKDAHVKTGKYPPKGFSIEPIRYPEFRDTLEG